MWLNALTDGVELLTLQVALVVLGFFVERQRPVCTQSFLELRFNLAYLAILRLLYAGVYPLSMALTTMLVNQLGGGIVELPASGYGLLLAIPVYVLAMDAGEYLFHRAQHRFPMLWAMHSLHHSDPALNVSTTFRHFWGDRLLKSMTVYVLVGVLFRTNAMVVGVYSIMGLYNLIPHLNVRVGFGRWSAWLNSPQLHRLHHSALPEHHNCNFNQFFPLFDVLCGTFRQPEPDEYPRTGLVDGYMPTLTFRDLLFWPWRCEQSSSVVRTDRIGA